MEENRRFIEDDVYEKCENRNCDFVNVLVFDPPLFSKCPRCGSEIGLYSYESEDQQHYDSRFGVTHRELDLKENEII